ncbi:ras-related protein Rab-24 isoform X2 [Nematostella vectensis]|uniref:ras-related protein Rab-24 isoform X2 n=1 Tax=Nematostella vectensis TaxID=45351 RepID=UPI00207737AF|nr:ras-related protein Rab-24 isoform X2 [Nematostella vectensis]
MGSKVDVKVVLLGKEYSGKTSLVERYLHHRFNDNCPYQNTIGAAFGANKVTVGNKCVTLGIWDTAGSERYEVMSRIYYRGAKGAVVCYDLTDRTSFDRAKFWVNELKTYESNCKIYLCGTKCDIVQHDKKLRKVDYHMTTDYADEIGGKVFETSSKTGHNVDEVFYEIAQDYTKEEDFAKNAEEDHILQLQDSPQKHSQCCGLR